MIYLLLLCSISIFAQDIVVPPRTCSMCKETKPVSNFSGDSKTCKSCVNKAANEKKRKEQQAEERRRQQQLEDERIAQEMAEKERIAREQAERERIAREEAERKAQEQAKREKEDREGVDLGLPSGTLWATRNVGANSPEDYGDKFAWGEIKGFMSGKHDFNWNTYKWGEENKKWPTYTIKLTKYCNKKSSGKKGFIDRKEKLDMEDDAAYVNWGSQWCMPSAEQLEELIKNCTWTWTTYKGRKGYLVKGKNGNSIFLPAAGYDHRFHDAETRGCYWTSSLFANNPTYAYYLDFSESSWSSTKGINYFYRYYGRSVRPVRQK